MTEDSSDPSSDTPSRGPDASNPGAGEPGFSEAGSDPSDELAPPPLSESGKVGLGSGDGQDVGSPGAGSDGKSEALEDPERLRELQESLGRLEEFATQAQAENTIKAYAADLEDFRHWCKKMGREWLPATPKTVGLYLGTRADDLSLATLERRLAAIASLHKEKGYASPASVVKGPLRKIWKGLVREKTRQQDGAPPLKACDLGSIINCLPRYFSSDDETSGELALTLVCDRVLCLVG